MSSLAKNYNRRKISFRSGRGSFPVKIDPSALPIKAILVPMIIYQKGLNSQIFCKTGFKVWMVKKVPDKKVAGKSIKLVIALIPSNFSIAQPPRNPAHPKIKDPKNKKINKYKKL